MVHIQKRKIYEKKHRDQIKYLDLSVICGYGLLMILTSTYALCFLLCQDHKKWTWLFIIFLSYFHFLFNLFSYFLFIELRVRIDQAQITRHREKR